MLEGQGVRGACIRSPPANWGKKLRLKNLGTLSFYFHSSVFMRANSLLALLCRQTILDQSHNIKFIGACDDHLSVP